MYDVLLRYFDPKQPFDYNNSNRYSTLVAALRDCRMFSRRDIKTGLYKPEIKIGDEGNWLAAIGYFTILDQIGSCYMRFEAPEPAPNVNTISFAIEQFAFDLIEGDQRKLHALKALRNAFTHDFNLLNVPSNEKLNYLELHKFTVSSNVGEDWIVKLPSRLWDGDIEGKDFNDRTDSTFINLFAFGNLVEAVCSRVYELIKLDKIKLRIPLPILINKYTFVTSDHPIK